MLASDSDAYYAPPDGDRDSYVQFVANLPTGDTVGLFGPTLTLTLTPTLALPQPQPQPQLQPQP